MDGQKDVIEIIPSKPSPPKNLPSTNASPGASKLFIITPDRIAKLGLTQQINKSFQSQQIKSFPTPPPGLQISKVVPSSQARPPAEDSHPKKNIKISKITLVTPREGSLTPSRSEGSSTKESVTLSMKNKLTAVLNRQHALPQVDDASKRRKRENIETLVSKISKNKDDDVIIIDAPKKESPKVPENKVENIAKVERRIDDVIIVDQTLEKAKIAQELKGYSKPIVLNLINNIPISSDLNISVSKKTESENVSVVEIQSSPASEETKQKITVLSNEQISLPNTYIASLKMKSQEQKMFLSKTPASNSPVSIIDENAEIEEENVEIVEIKEGNAEIKKAGAEIKKADAEIEEKEKIHENKFEIKEEPQRQSEYYVKEEADVSSESEKVECSTMVSRGLKHANQDDGSIATLSQNNENTCKIKNPDDKSSKPNNSQDVKDSPGQLKQDQQTINQDKVMASKPANADQKGVKSRPAEAQIIDLSEISDHEENVNKPNLKKSNEASKEKAKQSVIKKSIIVSKVVKPNGEELKLNTAIIKTYSKKINSLLSASLAQEAKEAKETAASTNVSIEKKDNSAKEGSKNENVDNRDANADKTETPQQTPEKPPPKKRGRKRKSEIIPVEEPPEPEPEIEMSRRGRKRKVVNYFALAEGDEFGEPSVPFSVNRRQTLETSDPEFKSDKSTSSESEQPKNISVDSTTPQETPPKRKRGRPPRIKPVENTPTEKKADETPAKDVEQMDTSEAATDVKTPKTEGETVTVKSELNDSSMTETDQEGSTDQNTSEFLNSSQEESALPPKKRRGRKPKVQILAEVAAEANKLAAEETPKKDSDTDATPPSVPEKRRVGRPPRKHPLENVDSNSSTPISDTGNVTCAVCNKNMTKPQWSMHKYKFHNNLAWRVGDPPLNLDDQKLVISILSELYKKRKPMRCEKCGEQKKSVVGFLSHKSLCQKSAEEVMAVRVKCDYCTHSVLPVSMTAHLKYCKGFKGDDDQTDQTPEQIVEEPDLSNKRKAASRAKDLISSFKEEEEEEGTKTPKGMRRLYFQNFNFKSNFFMKRKFKKDISTEGKVKCPFENCTFKTSEIDKICSHLSKCENKPTEGFTCKFCVITFVTEDEMHQHLKDMHLKSTQETKESEQSDENEEDCDDTGVNKASGVLRSIYDVKFLFKQKNCPTTHNVIYPPAAKWALAFCSQNFSESNLFPNWRTLVNWEKLDPKLIVQYLPHLKYSACTSNVSNNGYVNPLCLEHHWKRYKLFEAEMLENGTSILFCGGPIFGLAWIPTPYDQEDCDQILAVSTIDCDKKYRLSKVYGDPGLIQIWNCGPLRLGTRPSNAPKLEFCIAHDYGPIWHIEWCPSGCYDLEGNSQEGLRRLGVLAVASGDSNIYLYSVCFPGQSNGKIFKPKPVLKLVLSSPSEEVFLKQPQVTKISWSKASGHQYLAAGYGNGQVAIFNISSSSCLLRLGADENGIEQLMPYQCFTTHSHAVTSLGLHHLNKGRRWLMSGSTDRTIKYWDLENPSIPISNFTRTIVNDGVWLSHWLCSLHTYDDSCASGPTSSTLHQLRNYESEHIIVQYSNSRVITVTASEWANGFIQGSGLGEILAFFPHQLFWSMENDKTFKIKRTIAGYACLIEKHSTSSNTTEVTIKQKNVAQCSKEKSDLKNASKSEVIEPVCSYKETEEKYGIVFCDMIPDNLKKFPQYAASYSSKMDKVKANPHEYPLREITRVAVNPNRYSYSFLASGYQAGFVRITNLVFLS